MRPAICDEVGQQPRMAALQKESGVQGGSARADQVGAPSTHQAARGALRMVRLSPEVNHPIGACLFASRRSAPCSACSVPCAPCSAPCRFAPRSLPHWITLPPLCGRSTRTTRSVPSFCPSQCCTSPLGSSQRTMYSAPGSPSRCPTSPLGLSTRTSRPAPFSPLTCKTPPPAGTKRTSRSVPDFSPPSQCHTLPSGSSQHTMCSAPSSPSKWYTPNPGSLERSSAPTELPDLRCHGCAKSPEATSTPAAASTPASHSQPSGVASERLARVTSPGPGSSGARGKRPAPAREGRPGPGRRDRIARPRRWQCEIGAPAAAR
eukprot:scaffold71475_cov67-Phaeocystis_antarctica.AAC.2